MSYIKLGDIIHIKHGWAFKGDFFTNCPTEYLVTTPANFTLSGGFQETDKFYNSIDFPKEFILNKNDLIVTMTDLSKNADTIGFGALVPENGNYRYLHNQRIGLVDRISCDFDKFYIYWLMRTKHYQRSIANTSNGATVHHTSPERIYKYKVKKVDITTQRNISKVLCSYDSLIENNIKRIRFLQHTVQEIFKEWFVRFRFPGYQKATFENGIPNGWSIRRIKDFGKVITGKTPSTVVEEYYGDYIPFVKTPDMHGNWIIEDSSEKLSEKGSKSTKSTYIPANSIVVSCIGTVGICSINLKPIHTNQQINSIILDDKNKLYWLYMQLRNMKQTIEMFGATGATMLNLSKGKFEKLKLLTPSDNIVEQFHFIVKPIFDELISLKRKNLILIKQRDLLLPRLMSGKLEVK